MTQAAEETVISMTNTVTIMRESVIRGRLLGRIVTVKYKELEKALAGEHRIIATYYHGQAKRRAKQLEALGFKLEEIIWRNTDSITGNYREVWVRA